MIFAITLTSLTISILDWSKKYLTYVLEHEDWLDGFVLAHEKSADDHDHYHLFFRTNEPLTFNEVRWHILNMLYPGVSEFDSVLNHLNIDIQACKSERSWLKYITKEDANPSYKGVRTSFFSFYWHLMKWIKKNREYDPCSSFIIEHHNKVNVIKNAHSHYWKRQQEETLTQLSGPFTFRQAQLYQKLDLGHNYYIYGQSGAGKTTVVERWLSVRGLRTTYLSCTETQFEFGDITDATEVVYAPDVLPNWLDRHHTTLLRLCDQKITTVECKYIQSKRVLYQGIVIIVSNYPPNRLPGFERRFIEIDIDGLLQEKR